MSHEEITELTLKGGWPSLDFTSLKLNCSLLVNTLLLLLRYLLTRDYEL